MRGRRGEEDQRSCSSAEVKLRSPKKTHGQARVVTSTAGDKHHTPTPPNDAEVGLESSEGDGVRVKVDTTTHRVDHRLGLLVDLLLHEVIERSLHDCSEFDLESLDSTDGRHAVVATEAVDVELCEAKRSAWRSLISSRFVLSTRLPRQCERYRRPRGRARAWCAQRWRKRPRR